METVEFDVNKTFRVWDTALEVFLQDFAEWRNANFITVDGVFGPSGMNAFEQDRQRFTDWRWRREGDQLSAAKLAAYRAMHSGDPRPASIAAGAR
jgi:hypothetical protein